MPDTSAVPDGRDCGETPVDHIHLARQTLGMRSLEREVLGLFATQSVIYADKLRDAKTREDRVMAVHTLKGSAQGIGAWRVVEAARCIEAAERGAGDLPDCADTDARTSALIGEVAATNAYICLLLAED